MTDPATGRKRSKSKACPCGCGQADGATARLRKAECRGCGCVVRLSRQWIAIGMPTCACGEPFELRCLEDRVIAGDDDAYAELVSRDRARWENAPNVGIRRQAKCSTCHKFKQGGPASECQSCGYTPGVGYAGAKPDIPF